MDSFVENTGVAEQEKQVPVVAVEKAEIASVPLVEEVKDTNEGVEDTMWKSQEREKQVKIVRMAEENPDLLGRRIAKLPLNEMKAGYDYAFGKGKTNQRRV